MATERLQKILARGGIASRRAAEGLITQGRVRVNGHVVSELGAKADPQKDRIEIDGQRVVSEHAVYVILHKPRGVVATMSDPEGRPSVKELLAEVPGRIYPVGRLDFATSGVLLATNDGDFAEGMMHPKKAVPKTYVLKVSGVMQPEDIEIWRKGIRLEDGMTLPAQAKLLRHEGDKTWLELTIREGRNQQIRRMGEATRFPVMRLARIAFAGITSEGLRPGAWRFLTREELLELKKEYGVPKRIPPAAALEMPAPGRRTRKGPERPPRGAARGERPVRPARGAERAERPARGAERAERPARGAERADRGERDARGSGRGARAEARPSRREAPSRGPSRGAPPRGGAPSRSGPPAQSAGGDTRGRHGRERAGEARGATDSPRYGGGSPGRRGYDVREDWGGGAGRGRTGSDCEGDSRGGGHRGSSGGRDERQSAPPRADVGGRGGASRTTGTGGGIGASPDNDYRMRGRKR